MFLMLCAATVFISVDAEVPSGTNGVSDTAAFVKELTVTAEVRRAEWTVSGLGVFRAFLNGQEVGGEDFLKPGYTHIGKRRLSSSYDVTHLLKRGKNVLAAEVSTGWWRDEIVHSPILKVPEESGFCGELRLTHADGTIRTIPTDTTWRGAYHSETVHASIFWGEEFDARVGGGWRVGEGVSGWKPAKAYAGFKGVVTPLQGPPVRIRLDLAMSPVSAFSWKAVTGATERRHGDVVRSPIPVSGKIVLEKGEALVLDFGQNAAGVPEFTARAAEGTRLCARPAEMLNEPGGDRSRLNDGPGGSVYTSNYSRARTTLGYVFGSGMAIGWHPSFTFFGGRYWSMTATGRVEFEKIEWLPVTSVSADSETGRIETGDAGVNRLISNCVWGMRSNYLSVPTDCPQRSERLGWSGDAAAFIGAAVYAADVRGFFAKWMTDMCDTRMGEGDPYPGSFRRVAPPGVAGSIGHTFAWTDAGIIIPYEIWRQYGDLSVAKASWREMKEYVELVGKTHFRTRPGEQQCCDWLSDDALESWRMGWGAPFAKVPFRSGETKADERSYWDMVGACYRIMDFRMMRELSEAMGDEMGAKRYGREESRGVSEFRGEYLDFEGRLPHRYRSMQTPNLLLLKLGLFPTPAAESMAAADLVSSIRENGFRLKTGFIGTQFILDVLTEVVGDDSLAYSILLNRDCPGWLYQVEHGATTVWERWDGYTAEKGFASIRMNSFNHYAYGAVLGWMYRAMAGILPGKNGGYRRFVLRPRPDRRIGWCRASLRTLQGVVESSWRYDGSGAFCWDFNVPEGASADVYFPGHEVPETFGPGRHHHRNEKQGPPLKQTGRCAKK